MRSADWTSPCGTVELHCCDCLDVLPTLEKGSVDAVVTDPPYMIGAVSVGNEVAKAGTWHDMMNSARWFSDVFGQCRDAAPCRVDGPAGVPRRGGTGPQAPEGAEG